jgi:hypothetical protein
MGDVYANAVCTIAATSAENSSGGLFFDRCPQLHIPRCITFDQPHSSAGDHPLVGTYLCDLENLMGICIELAPLKARAWVHQERQLSRRILHFASSQVFWECLEGAACESYPEGLPPWARANFWLAATELKHRVYDLILENKADLSDHIASPTSQRVVDANTIFAWLIFRDQYSCGALSHTTDKLVAINGIATWVGRATGDDLVAGLWLGRIIEELCWCTTDPTSKNMVWRAPTWSWACSDAAIQYSLLTRDHRRHTSRLIEAELLDLQVKSKTSGELEHASMSIKCKLLRSTFWPAASFASTDPDLHGILILNDEKNGQDRIGWEVRLLHQAPDPDVSFYIDEIGEGMTGPQDGYICVLQHCVHESALEIPHGDARPRQKEDEHSLIGEKEEEFMEYESDGISDSVEALFLRMRDGAEEEFIRIGLVWFNHLRAASQILKAHSLAKERTITLF